MRQTIQVLIDLSTTFLWAAVAILVLLGGAKEPNLHGVKFVFEVV